MLTSEETMELIEERKQDMLQKHGKSAYMLMSEIIMLIEGMKPQPTNTRIIYLTEWNLYHSRPTVSALRNRIARRKQNGFDDVVSKDGKLWMIDEQKYFEWRKSRNIKE